MRWFSFVRLWILVGALACGAFALEYYPVQVVFVFPEVPTPVILAVGTPEELETLVFTIVEPPKFGVLLGFPPELVYIPHEGFIGVDRFSFLICDAKNGRILEYGTVRLRVIAPVGMISPSFYSRGTLTFSRQPLALDRYDFVFSLDALFQYLKTHMGATWDHTGFTRFKTWAEITLEGDWPVPWHLPIRSIMDFSPPTLSLISWTVFARTTILGWDFSGFFFYSGIDPQTRSYTTFTIRGSVDRYFLRSQIKFATLTPTFDYAVLRLDGPWPCGDCPIKWELEFKHKRLGFDHLSFTIKDVPIPCPACEPFRISMDTEIKFTTKEKKVAPRLRLWPVALCVRPLVELLTPPVGFGIDGLHLYGMEIRCDLPKGYKIEVRTLFDPAKDWVRDGLRIFQVMQVGGTVTPCCGWMIGLWQISAYFRREAGQLFGLGIIEAFLSFPISNEVTLNTRLTINLVDPDKSKLTFGWIGMF